MTIPEQSDAEAPAAERRPKTGSPAPWRKMLPWAAALFVVAGAVALYILAHARDGVPDPYETMRHTPGPGSIKVQVLNASGNAGIAQIVTDILRSKGHDVVEIGNASLTGRSIVTGRSARTDAPSTIAADIGLPADRTASAPDSRLMLDVTVTLGRDAESLPLVRQEIHRRIH